MTVAGHLFAADRRSVYIVYTRTRALVFFPPIPFIFFNTVVHRRVFDFVRFSSGY